MIAIIDPGSGNLTSVARALERVGANDVRITRDPDVVMAADRIVLPGQGAFAACQAGLSALPGMEDALNQRVRQQGRPFLGICVGMQLMAEAGFEHRQTQGLGWLPGVIAQMDPRDPDDVPLPLPQMGWNQLLVRRPHPVLSGLMSDAHAYFVHSFAWRGGNSGHILADTDYGGSVAAVMGDGNIVGTQFHVEKSGVTGLIILRNFLEWAP